MASILGLRQHMIDFHESLSGPEEQTASGKSFTFLVVVQLVVATPADVGLYLKARALLKDMQRQVPVLTTALQEILY